MKNIPEVTVTLWLNLLRCWDDRSNFLRCAIVSPGLTACQSEESSMGVPAWAEISRDASQAGNMESRGGTSGFPVHRLETSPTIATYTGEREANTRTNTNTRPDQSPSVGPAEVVWKIKREHTSKNSQVWQIPWKMNVKFNIYHKLGFSHFLFILTQFLRDEFSKRETQGVIFEISINSM